MNSNKQKTTQFIRIALKKSGRALRALKKHILKQQPTPEKLLNLAAIRDVVGDDVTLEIQYLKIWLLGPALLHRGKPIAARCLTAGKLATAMTQLSQCPIFFTLAAVQRHCRFLRQPVGAYCLHVPEMAIVGNSEGLTMRLEYVNQDAIEGVYPAIQLSDVYLQNTGFDSAILAFAKEVS